MADTLECCSGIGAFAKLAIGKTGSTLTRMDFIDFMPQIVKKLSDGSVKAIRGSLDHQQTSVAEGILHIRFRTRFYMTAAKMDVLLLSLGFTEATNVYTMGDSIPDSTMVLSVGGKEHTFAGMVPSDFQVYGQKGADPIIIDIGWIAKTWVEADAGTYSFGTMVEGYVYPFAAQGSGQAATLALGAPYSMNVAMPQVRLGVDFGTAAEFNNSITATNICPTDHHITIGTSALYQVCDGTTTLFTLPMGGNVAGATFTWTLQRTVGTNNSTVFTIPNVKPIARMPRVIKNDFTRLPLNFEGYASGSTAALTCTNKNAEA